MFLNRYHDQAAALGLQVSSAGEGVSVYDGSKSLGWVKVPARTQDITELLQEAITIRSRKRQQRFSEILGASRGQSFEGILRKPAPMSRRESSQMNMAVMSMLAMSLGGGMRMR